MTNVLKDIWEDRRRGVCWLPRHIFLEAGFDLSSLGPGQNDAAFAKGLAELVAVIRQHLENAVRLIEIVPSRETEPAGTVCGPLGMAVLTLRRIHAGSTFRRGSDVKISRRSVSAVTMITRTLARSNAAFRLLFGVLTRSLPRPRAGRHSIKPKSGSIQAIAYSETRTDGHAGRNRCT